MTPTPTTGLLVVGDCRLTIPVLENAKLRNPHGHCEPFACALCSNPNLCLMSAMIIPLVWSEVISELLMTLAPNAIINGAAARWLSR
jgi:hypothetical protein